VLVVIAIILELLELFEAETCCSTEYDATWLATLRSRSSSGRNSMLGVDGRWKSPIGLVDIEISVPIGDVLDLRFWSILTNSLLRVFVYYCLGLERDYELLIMGLSSDIRHVDGGAGIFVRRVQY
jgi:hypothetical protein